MAQLALERILNPKSVALVGPSARIGSVGRALLNNITQAGFKGEIKLVTPRYAEIDGMACAPNLSALDALPDLVVVAAPPAPALRIIEEAEALGVGGLIAITPDPHGPKGEFSRKLKAIAARSRMRILGPNCRGVMVPRIGFNASLSCQQAQEGDLALISQSSSVGSALLAWSLARGVGFSCLVSAGEMVDVDFGDLLDHFALDAQTRAILLFIDSLDDAQTFMSAARAAARAKPVIVMKSGRHRRTTSGRSLAENLAWPDAVYDAAFRRAGLLRAPDIASLFEAAEMLGRIKPFSGNRLTIVSNGGGLARLAADRLADMGGRLAPLEQATLAKLNELSPNATFNANPLDLGGEAGHEQYKTALEILLRDKTTDAILAMHAPTALSKSEDSASAVAAVAKAARAQSMSPKPIFAAWFGGGKDTDALFRDARVPNYETGAVSGFMDIVRWNEAREFLTSTPPNMPQGFAPDVGRARAIVSRALAAGHEWLSAVECAQLLNAYAIPVAPARLAHSPEEVAELARLYLARAGACVVKIASRDIPHKSDIGGVQLDLRSPDTAAEAAREILENVHRWAPMAHIDGFTVHPMIHRPHGRELFAGVAEDPTFGPVVVFGRGGKGVEVIEDRSLALPPLDLSLARDMIARTRVANMLKPYRDIEAADISSVALTLVKLAQMAADLPDLRSIDLNPLLADELGVMVVDSRIGVVHDPLQRPGQSNRRFAVAPYPKNLEENIELKDGSRVFLRPVTPQDENMYKNFFESIPPNDVRLRFFGPVKSFSHAFLARLTQIDYARAYALAAIDKPTGKMLGGVRLVMNAERTEGEFAILLGVDAKGKGLGKLLMQRMIDYARSQQVAVIEGFVLAENAQMLGLCRALGFVVRENRDEPGVLLARLDARNSIGA